jgi:energy-coupling factor transporter transmembrane protein EcfT
LIPLFFSSNKRFRLIDFRLRQLALMAYTILLVEPDLGFYIVFSMYLAGLYIYGRINPIPLLKGFAGFMLMFFLIGLTNLWQGDGVLSQLQTLSLVFWRYLLYFSLGYLLFQSTTIGEITSALAWLLRPLGHSLAITLSTMASLSIGFVPWIFDLAGKTSLALPAKGFPRDSAFLPLCLLSEPQPVILPFPAHRASFS